MKSRLLTTGLVCCIPLAVLIGGTWLLVRGIQWERRKGFHGRYSQPVEPWIHGDGGRPPVMQDHNPNGGTAAWKKT